MSDLDSELRWGLRNRAEAVALFGLAGRERLIDLVTEKLGYPEADCECGEGEMEAEVPQIPITSYDEFWAKGARHSANKLQAKGIIFHHAAGYFDGTIYHLTKNRPAASYHVLIGEDGRRVRFVDDEKQAWHAGSGRIKGRNPNHVCLGVAFVGDTVTGKYREGERKSLSEVEIASALEFIVPRWERFGLSFEWCETHGRVDPDRRNDTSIPVFEQMMAAMREAGLE